MLACQDEDREHRVASTSRDSYNEGLKTASSCFDDRILEDSKKQKEAHKEAIVGLVLGVAVPVINSCPHSIELPLSSGASVLELKACNSEDEFWVENLKDKKASPTGTSSPEKVGSSFDHSQEISLTQSLFFFFLKKLKLVP